MESAEIRRRWLDFFEKRGHTVVPSAPLLADDPTLLLVDAGMVPFKPYFLGDLPAPWPRATSVQKVVRTLDIDEVGKTTRHATFFQMCGNFSFGDYFKERRDPARLGAADQFARRRRLRLRPELLWVTVYHDDDEAAGSGTTWSACPSNASSAGAWPTTTGRWASRAPCGPCSEIYYDRGPSTAGGRRSGRQRGALPRGLEPRLHAVRARRRRQ